MKDLKQLRAFVAVAESGSFTAAAQHLGMTTPAVSKAVSRLEEALDTRLFRRTTRRIALTEEGRLYLTRVTSALAELDRAEDLLKESRQEPSGVIRVLTNAAVGKHYLLPIVAPFLGRYPKIDLELRFDDGQYDLVKEGFDFSLQLAPAREISQVCRHLMDLDLELVLVASPRYLASHGVPRTPADLARHRCINVLRHSGHDGIWEFSGEACSEPEVVHPQGRLLVAGQYDAVLDAALQGLGVTVVFANSALPYLRAGELRILLPEYDVKGGGLENQSLHVRYPHRRFMRFAVRLLLDYLVEHFRSEAQIKFDRHRFAA